MSSFFEKLKRGMGIEESIEKPTEETMPDEEGIIKPVEKTEVRKTGKEKPAPILEKGEEKKQLKKLEIETSPVEKKAEEKAIEKERELSSAKNPEDKEKWFEPEGQLAIDIYQTEQNLVIQSAIAGIKPESLDISIEQDVITIKGTREKPFDENGDYFSQECFWGPFSREVVLPAEIDPDRVTAEMKNGILTIRIPKILREKRRKIEVMG